MSFHRATALVGACAALAVPFVACSETHFDTLCDLHPEQCCDLDPTLPGCGDVGAEASTEGGETSTEGGTDADAAADADADAPTETGPLCTKGEIRCTGPDLEQCATDGMSWLKLTTCPSASTCDAKAGRCTACTPDAYRCDGAKRLQCDKLGKTEAEVATCDTLELCVASTGATCAKAACAVGEKKCEGAKAMVCNAGRTGFDSTTCASAALCAAGVCTSPSCSAAEKRCSGKKVQTCKADLTGWDDTETCAIDCDGGTSPACLKVTQLACGANHSCVLLSNKTVRCWGDSIGALGTVGSSVPKPTALALTTVEKMSIGREVTAVLRTDKSVVWWGRPPLAGGATVAPTPLALGAVAPSDLSVSATHLCIRDSDGVVKCLGKNADGSLGNGTTTDSSTLVSAIAVVGAGPVSVGEGVSFATVAAGDWRGWGANATGVLGDGSTTRRLSGVTTYASALEVLSAGLFSCARYASGTVSCAGDAPFLGAPTSTPKVLAGLVSVTQFSVAATRGCARSLDGSVRCWGDPPLGDGSTAPSAAPVLIGNGMRLVAVGDGGGCVAMADETTVKCWGPSSQVGAELAPGTTIVTPVAVVW